MAIYAIGDLQGCYDPFQRLLERLRFDPTADQLWLVGDLVNRGPDSLRCLHFIRDLGDRAVAVLGNHDFTLLLAGAGLVRANKKDTLDHVLAAPDRDELLHWLRHRPLIHHDAARNTAMIHAGLAPTWTVAQALALAEEVHAVLRGDDYLKFFADLFGDRADTWRDDLVGSERLRVIVNFFTRVRGCTPEGVMDFRYKSTLAGMPAPLIPWFQMPARRSRDTRLIFGHWAGLGAYRGHHVVALDSGCVWGNALTAIRVDDADDAPFVSVSCGQ